MLPVAHVTVGRRALVVGDRCGGDNRFVCHRETSMSPTVFRDGPFRFFFSSREEERLHVHVQSADGEAKVWIEPRIEVARNYELSDQDCAASYSWS
jgi:hypothetical protein